MKIIFLDIDGVLNCENAYRSGECRYTEWTNHRGDKDHHQSFCSWSKELLNKLIDETNAKIVISSTWRSSGIEFMKSVWELEGMSGEIIGLTPNFRGEVDGYTIPRGCEIEKWLRDNGFSHINWDKDTQQEYINKTGIENYIIIDDDSDMLYNQRNHFVHVLPSPRNKDGFNQHYYEIARAMLEKTVIDLNY
jgi:HAD domain in Swiss Army Knife RNA repair proteins